jgi:hypothetical protein
MHHLASGHLTGHQAAEHVLVWHTVPGYARILPESEAAVEGWITDQNTPAGSPKAQCIKTGLGRLGHEPVENETMRQEHPGTCRVAHSNLSLQLTAFFTSAAIFASSAAVNCFNAKATGHMAPSSR